MFDQLLRLARLLCTDADREHIVEPLMADWQQELAAACTDSARRVIVWRGIAAFWQTVALCGLRSVWMRAVRVTPMSVLVGVYSVVITLGVVFGFNHWVRTGQWSLHEG